MAEFVAVENGEVIQKAMKVLGLLGLPARVVEKPASNGREILLFEADQSRVVTKYSKGFGPTKLFRGSCARRITLKDLRRHNGAIPEVARRSMLLASVALRRDSEAVCDPMRMAKAVYAIGKMYELHFGRQLPSWTEFWKNHGNELAATAS